MKQVLRGQVDRALAWADAEDGGMLTDGLGGVGDLVFAALAQFLDEAVVDGAGIEAGRAEFIEEHVTGVQRQQALFPSVADRAFLGQERARAELESNRAQLWVVDPVFPLFAGTRHHRP